MDYLLLAVVALVALGFVAIVLEFFVPGMALGAIGGCLLLAAVVGGFVGGPTQGLLTLLASIVSGVVAVFLGARLLHESPVTLKQTQGADQGFVSGPEGLGALAGKQGRSVTVLRPAGLVEIEDRKIDVVTEGEMIGEGKSVEVLRVEGSRVVVREVRKPT